MIKGLYAICGWIVLSLSGKRNVCFVQSKVGIKSATSRQERVHGYRDAIVTIIKSALQILWCGTQ